MLKLKEGKREPEINSIHCLGVPYKKSFDHKNTNQNKCMQGNKKRDYELTSTYK